MEGGGATVGPLAGARVHPMGERAAVERPGGGAQTSCPACRRGGELLFKQAPHGGGSKLAQGW
jgi:hypothetical protein